MNGIVGFLPGRSLCLTSLVSLVVLLPAAQGQTFTVTAPSSLTIYPGQQNVPLAVSVANNTGPVLVTLTGLPSGITVTPLTLTAGSTTGSLNLSASLSAGQEGFPVGSEFTSWTAPVNVVAAAGSTQATTPLALTVSISNPSFTPAPSAINLPVVTINTSGTPIVNKTTDVPGTITITSADGQTSYLPNSSDTDNTATFHVHGNTTATMPKLPYHVKLNTSLDLLHAMGLNCPYITSKGKAVCDKSKSYILLANYDDKTLLRDWSASALANAIPIGNGYLNSPANSPTPSGTSTLMPWASHSLFVELFLNGVYEGNYQLIEEVKVDSNRVNITELDETDVTNVTGGYLLEIDEHQDEAFVFITPQGVPIGLIDPDFTPDPEIPQQTSYISSYVNAAESALFSDNFTDPTQGWRAYFDEASAVNFYLVNELMGNVDGGAFYSSDYLYKNIDNPLLYMGPIWDFDVAAGNTNYQPIVNPTVPWMQQEARWYTQWFKDPGFKADVTTQWNALKNNGILSSWLKSIPVQTQTLEQSQANNFGRWPMLGIEVWPNPEAAGSYDGEVAYFTNWLQLRFEYLDSLFNNKAQTTTSLSASGTAFRAGASVTFSSQVTAATPPSGGVSFLSGGILLGTAPVSGGAATFTTTSLPVGTDQIQAVYNGDDTNGLSASGVQTIAVTTALASAQVSLAGPATGYQGTSLAFSVSVIPNSGTAAPSGSITFTVDGVSSTSVSLNTAAQAATSLSSLALGTHTVTAMYSGDANYVAASASTSLSITVAPSFTVTGTAVSVTAGAASGNTSAITITPTNGFTGSVALVAFISSNPDGAAYPPTFSFGSTSPVAISGTSSGTATLTVITKSAAFSPLAYRFPHTRIPWYAFVACALAGLLLLTPRRTRRWRTSLSALLFAIMLAGGSVACGGGGTHPTTPGVYVVTITGASGSTAAHNTITVNVQ